MINADRLIVWESIRTVATEIERKHKFNINIWDELQKNDEIMTSIIKSGNTKQLTRNIQEQCHSIYILLSNNLLTNNQFQYLY